MAAETEVKTASRLASELFALMAFYLYFGGWVYASEIFRLFGISLGNTDTPAYYFIVYAYTVFFSNACRVLILLGIGGVWYALGRFRFVVWAEIVLVAAVTLLPFPLIRSLAVTQAEHDAANIRSGSARSVVFLPRKDADKYEKDLLALLRSGKLRLVLQTKDRYFVFLPQGRGEGNVIPEASLYDVPTSDFVPVVNIPDLVRR